MPGHEAMTVKYYKHDDYYIVTQVGDVTWEEVDLVLRRAKTQPLQPDLVCDYTLENSAGKLLKLAGTKPKKKK